MLYLQENGQAAGPYPLKQIKELIANGTITSEHPAADNTGGPWKPLREWAIFYSSLLPPPELTETQDNAKGRSDRNLLTTIGSAAFFLGLGVIVVKIVPAVWDALVWSLRDMQTSRNSSQDIDLLFAEYITKVTDSVMEITLHPDSFIPTALFLTIGGLIVCMIGSVVAKR